MYPGLMRGWDYVSRSYEGAGLCIQVLLGGEAMYPGLMRGLDYVSGSYEGRDHVSVLISSSSSSHPGQPGGRPGEGGPEDGETAPLAPHAPTTHISLGTPAGKTEVFVCVCVGGGSEALLQAGGDGAAEDRAGVHQRLYSHTAVF